MGSTFEEAKRKYSEQGIDVEKVLEVLGKTPISIHCWQGDDVGGFEHPGAVLAGGGIQVTGNYPGKARNLEELRADMEKMLSLVPGVKKIALHASYGDFGGQFVDRDAIEPKHFASWVEWARKNNIGLDFNGTFFSHPYAADGFTLSSKDPKIRAFWIEHEKRCRKIADYIGAELGIPCVLNTWVPDGAKEYTMDKIGYRKLLKEALDECFAIGYPKEHMVDALETKLFGIGVEAFTTGSHEFYMEYAAKNNKTLCMDLGHFHTGEDVSDKLSSILLFQENVLLHLSRPMRWDSDHVVVFNDTLRDVAQTLVFSGKLDKTFISTDYFDGSINRIGAWAVGVRAVSKAFLFALLSPKDQLIRYEEEGKGFEKLALLELQKVLPFGDIWDEYCRRCGVAAETEMVADIEDYEKKVLCGRN